MDLLILSPHPDDAVLSCGGLIAERVRAGDWVTIVTLMAGPLPPDLAVTPYIEEHFQRWELVPDPVPGRQAEDRRAAQALGADLRFGALPDALYRTDGAGRVLYPDRAGLFGPVDPDDPAPDALVEALTALPTPDALYTPLGAGHHVDHMLVRDAARAWAAGRPPVAVFYYEEYPYSAIDFDAIERARGALGTSTQPEVIPLSPQALDAKIAAIACHRSQISTFWRDAEEMTAAVRAYAREVGRGGYAERVWRPAASPLAGQEKSS